jgi:hypothetical protein
MKGRRAVLILKILMLCACLAIVVAGSAREAGSVALLDVPIPSIVEEPSHTVGTSNVVFWSPVVHTDLTAYRIQASLSPSFNAIWRTQVVWANWDSTTFTDLPLDTMWYRVQAAYIPAADTFWSEWSDSVFSVQDIAAPTTDCGLIPDDEWSTLDTFTLIYHVEDPAGIESIFLYLRTGGGDEWSDSVHVSPAGAPTSYDGTWSINIADYGSDTLYEFYVGARDDAKAKDWYIGDERKSGNVDRPQTGDPPMCSRADAAGF